tara:strand:- start:741 stop:977 length:237 start_codon:yes stop_codon:yes gene_type:complete
MSSFILDTLVNTILVKKLLVKEIRKNVLEEAIKFNKKGSSLLFQKAPPIKIIKYTNNEQTEKFRFQYYTSGTTDDTKE